MHLDQQKIETITSWKTLPRRLWTTTMDAQIIAETIHNRWWRTILSCVSYSKRSRISTNWSFFRVVWLTCRQKRMGYNFERPAASALMRGFLIQQSWQGQTGSTVVLALASTVLNAILILSGLLGVNSRKALNVFELVRCIKENESGFWRLTTYYLLRYDFGTWVTRVDQEKSDATVKKDGCLYSSQRPASLQV